MGLKPQELTAATVALVGMVLTSSGLEAAEGWPFAPIKSPPPPQVDSPMWSANPVDAFVYSRLRKAELSPAPPIDRRTWIRRVTFDLTGLPPRPQDVKDFVTDPRPDAVAYAEVVDRLLASPQYAEHWARHWLDVVRYADTDGFAIDGERPTLWRYRDYVIDVFNEDRPFDRFIREQLAGDEIDAGPEGLVATGFYRLGPWEADNMVRENRRQDYLNEITMAVGNVFLGLTVGCARCHDHKFDPILQKDFYQLQAFLSPLERSTVEAGFRPEELTASVRRRKQRAEAELQRRQKELHEFSVGIKRKLAEALDKSMDEVTEEEFDKALDGQSEQFKLSDEQRERYEQLKKAVDDYKVHDRYQAVACTIENPEPDDEVPVTHLLRNGDVFAPGERVQPAFLSAVDTWTSPIFEQQDEVSHSAAGRRRVLADWIASAENPLTARVLVNRVWQYHMGQGLVATPNNFGSNGSGPSHPELLDFLASWFMNHDWQLKPLHRLLVLSRTYRTASTHPDADSCAAVDPQNRLLWRAHFRRLQAEAVRDTVLKISGRLSAERGGPGFYEALPDEMETNYPFFEWHASSEKQRRRRSIYMFQRRNLVHPMIEVFDAADMNQSCPRRKTSVTALQSLTIFNSDFAHRNSRYLAERLLRETGEDPAQPIERLFWLAYSRPPDPDEIDTCLRFLQDKRERYQQRSSNEDEPGTSGEPRLRALADLCLAVINTNEFLYLD